MIIFIVKKKVLISRAERPHEASRAAPPSGRPAWQGAHTPTAAGKVPQVFPLRQGGARVHLCIGSSSAASASASASAAAASACPLRAPLPAAAAKGAPHWGALHLDSLLRTRMTCSRALLWLQPSLSIKKVQQQGHAAGHTLLAVH